jgi:hypothetical protein
MRVVDGFREDDLFYNVGINAIHPNNLVTPGATAYQRDFNAKVRIAVEDLGSYMSYNVALTEGGPYTCDLSNLDSMAIFTWTSLMLYNILFC